MNEEIKKIVELEIDLDNLELEDMGVDVVSFVNEPAIEVDFMAFSKQEFVEPNPGESEDDFIGRCMPIVTGEGYDQDQALAICYSYYEGKQELQIELDIFGFKPEYFYMCPAAITLFQHLVEMNPSEDVKGMIRSAALQADKIFDIEEDVIEEGIATEDDLKQAILFANDFADLMREIDELVGMQHDISWVKGHVDTIASYYNGEFEYNPSSLSPYIDYGDDLRKKEFAKDEDCYVLNEEEEKIILKWAREHGEQITEDYTFIKPQQEFNTVSDVAEAIQGLDILGKMGVRQDEPAEIKYLYSGPDAQRNFCKALKSLNKLYSFADMRSLRASLSTINPGMGPRGRNSYDVFRFKGGVNCRHYWSEIALFKPEGSRKVLMIDKGPAEGDAGKTNNEAYTSGASGAVSNNASLRRRNFAFSLDDEKRIVAGPLMIPNRFILRRDENGEPYYVFFSKNTIKRIQERFNKQQRQNHTDVDHDGNILDNNILLEQWVIESRVHDKSRYYGFDSLPTGTWFGVYKVNDDKTWQRIKNGELKGFSIAGDFINKAQPTPNSDEDLLGKIVNILTEIK